MTDDAKQYYTGIVLHALILKEKNLTASSIWSDATPQFNTFTRKLCKIADSVAQEMVRIQQGQEDDQES
jgi:hypothetical protein